jgi:hypothetical protein
MICNNACLVEAVGGVLRNGGWEWEDSAGSGAGVLRTQKWTVGFHRVPRWEKNCAVELVHLSVRVSARSYRLEHLRWASTDCVLMWRPAAMLNIKWHRRGINHVVWMWQATTFVEDAEPMTVADILRLSNMKVVGLNHSRGMDILFSAQQPSAGHGRLIFEICRSHTMTHHNR